MSFLDMDVERIVEQYPDAVGKTLMTKQHTRTVLFYLNESGEVVTIFETHNQSLALEMRSRLNSPRQSGKTIKMNEIIQQIKQDNPLIEGHYLHLMVKDEYYSLRIGNVCIYTTKMKELALELQTSLNSEPKVFNNLLASLPTGLRLIVKPAPFGGEGWLVQDWDNRTQLTLDTKEIAEKLVSTHNQKQSPEAQPDAVIKLLSTAKNGYVQTIDRLEKELLELRLLEKQTNAIVVLLFFYWLVTMLRTLSSRLKVYTIPWSLYELARRKCAFF